MKLLPKILNRFFGVQMNKSAGGWLRSREVFTKEKSIGDGEIAAMLVQSDRDAFLERIYPEMKAIVDLRYRSAMLLLASYAFAVLVLVEASESFSVSGLNLKSEFWPHISIAIISFFSMRFSEQTSKNGYFSSIFVHYYTSSSPSERNEMLLRYPQAFAAFQFNRTIRGFPKHIQPKHWPKWEGWALMVLIVLMATIWIIPVGIFIYSAIVVWYSQLPTPWLSKIYVILIVFTGLISIANPTFTNLKRRYVHYGMSDTISMLPKGRGDVWHKRIAELRVRNDSLDP